ncbi:Crp/Fnr family transcriptional regulator [Hymenobacter artigasi]|uniref:CRP-like cAMP-binding protein n=1 Tax=Hymenobacter artigasi TaxID=2719616 RepID=A0ABX1HFX6_9BACT|nr:MULTISPECIES: Crp/Fnr family transcriptional regulator [Hymenobacter]MBU6121739.1 Crp/Fnr family transcriptional regulator [Hymenobacter siberiensis]NKI89154.1 CRP-like cAMP-binding protein [Hymenobacter artigasi]
MNSFVPHPPPDCRHWADALLASNQHMALIEAAKTTHHYQRGQVLFREGDHAAGLYSINSGHVKVTKVGGDGKEQIIRLARDGNILGYRGLLAGTGHAANALALDEAEVCFIPKSVFFQLIEHNPGFAFSLMKLMANELAETEERMLHLAYKPVRERLAEALLLLLRTYQQPADGPPSFTISREDLAALVGTVRETVSRFMAELKAEGVLSTKGSSITILDIKRLIEISTLYD